jgi:hypothetical protein
MKNKRYTILLPVLTAILGIACAAARWGLYLLATDSKGLLVPGHPLALFSWVLTAIAVVLSFSMAWMLKGSNHYCANFQPSAAAAIGSFVMAGGILLAVVCGWGSPMMLDRVCSTAGILSVPAIITAGIQRYLGKKPFFLFHVAACLFFLIHIVSHYQLWSGNPQMQDYVFSLLGATALMLFGFYAAAMEAGCGDRRMTLGTGLAAIYLCLAELARSSCPWLYLGGILWVLTDLLSLQNSETNH